MNIFDFLNANTKPGGVPGLIDRGTPPTGLAAILQQAQSPGAMAMSGSQASPQQQPQQPMNEQPRPMPAGMPPVMGGDPSIPYHPMSLPMDTSHRTGDKTRRIIGILGDALAGLNGQPGPYAAMMNRRGDQEFQSQLEEQRAQREEIARRSRGQVVNLGNGGVGTYSEDGGMKIVREPTQQQGEQERLLGLWSSLDDKDPRKAMLGTMLRGANLRPEVYQPMTDYKTAAQISAKGAPTYAATHPKSRTGAAAKPPTGYILD